MMPCLVWVFNGFANPICLDATSPCVLNREWSCEVSQATLMTKDVGNCYGGLAIAGKVRPVSADLIVKGFWQGDEMPCKILKDKIKTLGLIFLPYHHIGWVLCQPVPPWQWPQGSLWSWIWSGHCPHRRMAPGLLMDLSWLPRDLQPGVRWIGTTIMGTVLDDSPFPPLHKHNIGHSFPCPVQSSFWKFPWQAHNREPRYRTPRKLSWFQNSIL